VSALQLCRRTAGEPRQAHSDHRILEQRIADLERDRAIDQKGFTKPGVRKMIAKINEELAVFESREEAWLALQAPEAG